MTPGQEVRPDQMLANAPQLFAPLFVITNPSRLWVMLDVPEDLGLVHQGAAIALHAQSWPHRVFHGHVTLVAGALDPNTRTLKVRGVVDNDDGALKGEMLVTVELRQPAIAPATPCPRRRCCSTAMRTSCSSSRERADTSGARWSSARRTTEWFRCSRGWPTGERVVVGSALLLEQMFQTAARS